MNTPYVKLIAVWLAASIPFFGTVAGDEPIKANPPTKSSEAKTNWQPLVGSWKSISFGGEGNVEITPELISIGIGDPMTGIRWSGDVPNENYEIELEGRRTDGFDFFCGLTFPIGEGHASLILGGWGGGVVGLSSINDSDAANNETTQYLPLETKKWYTIRARVTSERVECWVDDKSIVDVERADRKFSTRLEMDSSTPLGIAAYQCKAEYRKLRIRALDSSELKAAVTSKGSTETVSKP
jgi:hypothetical protein